MDMINQKLKKRWDMSSVGARHRRLGGVVALLALILGLVAVPGQARADGIIGTGSVFLGVNDLGHLNTEDTIGVTINSGFTGLTFGPIGDATSPGCLCEGWGAAGSGISGFANEALGTGGLTLSSFTTDATPAAAGTFATSVVTLTGLPALMVTQAYTIAIPGVLFEDKVTITNTGAVTITDVRYTRVMDWDVPPTEFSEFVTIDGTAATALLFSSNNGFATADPLDLGGRVDIFGCGITVDFADCGPSDHGALFDFGFGDLAPGASIEFSIFYGAAETETAALAAVVAAAIELHSFGQSNTADGPTLGTPGTFIFGFKGVGGTPPACGDGALDPGEECDDGNLVDGDGCSSVCTIEPLCGNGVLDAGEECDDGNTVDGDGCSSACLLENESPVCSGAVASPATLWPPNHKMASVSIAGVVDPDGDPVTIAATSIFQDELVKSAGTGSGNTSPDGTLSPLEVRAERNGNPKTPGNGRVYHIGFTATDDKGATCDGEVEVCVPHDQGKGSTCVDGGSLYDSLVP